MTECNAVKLRTTRNKEYLFVTKEEAKDVDAISNRRKK